MNNQKVVIKIDTKLFANKYAKNNRFIRFLNIPTTIMFVKVL